MRSEKGVRGGDSLFLPPHRAGRFLQNGMQEISPFLILPQQIRDVDMSCIYHSCKVQQNDGSIARWFSPPSYIFLSLSPTPSLHSDDMSIAGGGEVEDRRMST